MKATPEHRRGGVAKKIS